MENEEQVDQETLNPEEETSDLNTEETAEPETDWQAEAEKLKQLAQNYKIRAEKAEKKAKEAKPEKPQEVQPKEERLSDVDLIAIAKSDIHADDIPEVVEYAKFKKIPVAEALKSDVIKTTLAKKAEERKTADATATKPARRSVSQKPSELDVYEKAEKGEISDDPAEMAKARTAKLRADAKN